MATPEPPPLAGPSRPCRPPWRRSKPIPPRKPMNKLHFSFLSPFSPVRGRRLRFGQPQHQSDVSENACMTSLSFKNSRHTAKIKTLADAAFLCVFGKTGHFVKYCGAGVTLLARLAGVLVPEPAGLWIVKAA